MSEIDKVIEGLEHCMSAYTTCTGCPYEGTTCTTTLSADVLALLKEQPNVVRCKDCKRRLECDYWIENGDDWFCADGKPKDTQCGNN